MRRFPKKKNTYGLKEIDDALKQAKLERHQEDVLRLNLLKIILSFLLPNKGRNLWVKYVDLVDDLDQFNRFPWVNKSIISCGVCLLSIVRCLKFSRIEESIHLFPKLQEWWMTSFKRRQIVTFKFVFTNPKLLAITMKSSETDMQQGLVQEAMIQLKTLIPKIPKKGLANRVSRKRQAEFPKLENIQLTVKYLLQKVVHVEGLKVVKNLMVDDDIEVRREVNFKAISFEYGGDLLKWKKGDEKYNDDKKDAEEKVKSKEEHLKLLKKRIQNHQL
ncbi:hypothetical protein GIB67_004898 [Kingdonia uniflora]|uniref:DUF1985 domain-containing protein n=1 Tax=Kingdonia uniflora TaxID=39325 RepID=A0A7J7LNH9_9MAGN|nr:hypothetical protein GIB67_004898 [Kingdonia uniflora]